MSGIAGTGGFPFQASPGWESFSLNARYNAANPYLPIGQAAPSTTATLYLTFMPIPQDDTIVGLGIYCVTGQANAKARIGIASNVRGVPTTWLLDAGEVLLTTSASLNVTNNSYAVSRSKGGLWVGVYVAGVATQPTLVCYSGGYPGMAAMSTNGISTSAAPRGYSVAATYPTSISGSVPTGLTPNSTIASPAVWVKAQ